MGTSSVGTSVAAAVGVDRAVQRARRAFRDAHQVPRAANGDDERHGGSKERQAVGFVYDLLVANVAHERGGQHENALFAVYGLVAHALHRHLRTVDALQKVEFALRERAAIGE